MEHPGRGPDDGLLGDDEIERLVARLAPFQRAFLAALARGSSPEEAAVRAGWGPGDAGRIARVYMASHPLVTPLAEHVIRLRELASLELSLPDGAATDTVN